MKKILTIVALCMAMAATSVAQEKAIGLRGGYYSTEITYQQKMGSTNKLEADLGFNWGGGISLTGVYQWTHGLPQVVDGLSWFVGPGAGIRTYGSGLGVGVGIVGQIGLEYLIPSLPLQVSVDWRPGLVFGKYSYNEWGGAAFALRYRF